LVRCSGQPESTIRTQEKTMNVFYIVGVIVVVGALLSFIGLR
jgi:hypothetical protein